MTTSSEYLRIEYVRRGKPGRPIWAHDVTGINLTQLECLAVDVLAQIAQMSGETPRTVAEGLFKTAPEDQRWRDLVV